MVCRGDVADQQATTVQEQQEVLVTPTIIATVLVYLTTIRTGPSGSGQLRYKQHKVGTPSTHGGFHVDDWVRGIHHVLYFLFRRRGKSRLDGDEGPKGAPGTALTFRVEDSSEMLAASEHDTVANNVQSLKGMRLAALTKSSKTKMGSSADRMKFYKSGEANSRMYRRAVLAMKADAYSNLERHKI
ncbi:hypothetical protein C8A00DRAFT_36099 [Chaetomidium leptoderma]|uniref:Uncharacterized protein n=1 Tax=Chaetomidium leptoderma TaxID=669021 RepID=A0AAN6VGU6_9PEZI|nr:hypothetical protein C8A00DRAFT_36099 [Chaetomidium leptoderma]